jgi:hypothetical protein
MAFLGVYAPMWDPMYGQFLCLQVVVDVYIGSHIAAKPRE